VREAHDAIAALGVRVVAVGAGSAAQAGRLLASGMPFACLVDADGALSAALGLGRFGPGVLFRADTYRNYLRAWWRGARQGARTGSARQRSGVALFDAEGRLRWLYRSSTVGDYPALGDVFETLRHAARA